MGRSINTSAEAATRVTSVRQMMSPSVRPEVDTMVLRSLHYSEVLEFIAKLVPVEVYACPCPSMNVCLRPSRNVCLGLLQLPYYVLFFVEKSSVVMTVPVRFCFSLLLLVRDSCCWRYSFDICAFISIRSTGIPALWLR